MMLGIAVFSTVILYAYAHGDILRGVDVPLYTFAGGQATLSCSYDLRSTRLYSLKWYHNGTEFYRYVPTERNTPINIKPSHKFTVTELFRDDVRVTLSLTRLLVSASGQYRCEVIAEHPSFRTEEATATMTVLREPLRPPELVGALDTYEQSEVIKIGCQPSRPIHGGHQPTLRWLLDDREVSNDSVTPYKTDKQKGGGTGLALHVEAEKIAEKGGTMKAECRMSLGPHELSSSKDLKVNLRTISIAKDYQAAGALSPKPASATRMSISPVALFVSSIFIVALSL